MVNIAIAGGNGAIGRTITEVLHEQDKYQIFILTRKAAEQSSKLQTITVDCKDVEDTKETLERNNIDTVICTFGINGDSLKSSQLSRIEAASRSTKTKRFIPTSYAIALVSVLPPLEYHFQSLDLLEQSDLEWTLITNGLFLDYYAMLHIKTWLQPNPIAIDIESRKAAIPGSGDAPVTSTSSYDVARFIAALVDTPGWSKGTRIIGEMVTWNEFMRIAEEVLGEKFDVTYDSVEKLKAFEITELPGHRKLYDSFPKKSLQWFLSTFELMTTDTTSCVPRDRSLNEVFPDIHPLTIRKMLTKYWKST